MSANDYGYSHGDSTGVDSTILQAVQALLNEHASNGARVLDLGCGNGYFSARLANLGYSVTGTDHAESGILQARLHHPEIQFVQLDGAESSSIAELGPFDALVSIEVIEHVRSTRAFVESVREALRPGGVAIVTTPYHGYVKNLLIAIAGRHDRHYDPLWEGGHIKFFSLRSLALAFERGGMQLLSASRVGRIAPIAKSIVAVFRRPR